MSHNFENLSLDLCSPYEEFKLPDFFYNSSSFKQLKIYSHKIVPYCTVSWTSLQKLSLRFCRLSDESMAKIISGCPVIENLTLYDCYKLKVLDLSKSLRLRTLVVNRNMGARGPRQIVAPHIHCLRLLHSQSSCTLVDVASLTEAKLDICYALNNPYLKFKAEHLQVMVLKNLAKLQNAEKLTFGGNFVKVKSLTLDTVICQYVIPGVERLLQNSPDLEKLIVRGRIYNSMPGEHLDQYLKLKSLSPDQCWRSKDGFAWNKSRLNVQPKHVTSFVELVLKNTEKLHKMVVLLDERYLTFEIEDVIPTLPHNSNVTIVLSSTNKPMASEEW
ncbi:hypothetical protein F2Q68_00017286 [Brassica cretica]|uniref:At1g61320/AtMIF1 LRR domain-containing protein n=1 Tax=Brassica cretica TaxID=69181 RepID=A0A8S9HFM9_BRACR|nr:hypothetical protein F2Q68_00017286 [Brassica cretica]